MFGLIFILTLDLAQVTTFMLVVFRSYQCLSFCWNHRRVFMAQMEITLNSYKLQISYDVNNKES